MPDVKLGGLRSPRMGLVGEHCIPSILDPPELPDRDRNCPDDDEQQHHGVAQCPKIEAVEGVPAPACEAQAYAWVMNAPSRVSMRLIPAANRMGSERTARNGTAWVATPAATASRPTSVAVSNPSPKRTPQGYICQLLLIRRKKP